MDELSEAISNLEEDKVLQLVKERIDKGEDPIKILDACRMGMAKIGEGAGDTVFLTDLIMAGEIFNEAMEILMPKLSSDTSENLGKVVIGTVQGDIHNIGKDIAINFLKAEGFEVIDLGVDVPPEKFVEAIDEYDPMVVGMSGLLTLSIEPMKKSVEAIKAANKRDKVKVIIGGERTDDEVCSYVGADAWVNDAIEGVKIIKKWAGVA
jgi:methanogenic corrinoid protein MtbC1